MASLQLAPLRLQRKLKIKLKIILVSQYAFNVTFNPSVHSRDLNLSEATHSQPPTHPGGHTFLIQNNVPRKLTTVRHRHSRCRLSVSVNIVESRPWLKQFPGMGRQTEHDSNTLFGVSGSDIDNHLITRTLALKPETLRWDHQPHTSPLPSPHRQFSRPLAAQSSGCPGTVKNKSHPPST